MCPSFNVHLWITEVLLIINIPVAEMKDVNACHVCACDDCHVIDHQWCYNPLHTHLKHKMYFFKTPIKRFAENEKILSNTIIHPLNYPNGLENISYTRNRRVDIDPYCYTLDWEEKRHDVWVKFIRRYWSRSEEQKKAYYECQKMPKDSTTLRNIHCEFCYFEYCNWRPITPVDPSNCYLCECDKCNDKDINCITPNRLDTPIISLEKFEEHCSTESWMKDDKLYIRRGVGQEVTDCKVKLFSDIYYEVVCNTCKGSLCNNATILPKKKTACFVCKCKDCQSEKDLNCLNPTTNSTDITYLMSDEKSCTTLTAIHKDNKTLLIERKGPCLLSYCKDRILALNKIGYTKFNCRLCRTNLCNNLDKLYLFKVLNNAISNVEIHN